MYEYILLKTGLEPSAVAALTISGVNSTDAISFESVIISNSSNFCLTSVNLASKNGFSNLLCLNSQVGIAENLSGLIPRTVRFCLN